MTFPERAVVACVKAMEERTVSPYLVNSVIKCQRVDVSPIVKFIGDTNEMVRMFAVKIVGEKSRDLSVLVQAAKKEENRDILLMMLKYVIKQGDSLQELVDLIHSEDKVVREEAIQMFRRAGRSDCLFTLLFDNNDELVQRIKKYIEEHV